LILDAADALARRNAAEVALSEAAEALSATLDELQKHGFELQEVAELLQIDPSELSGTGPSRRLSVRTSRSVKVQEPNETDEFTDSEPGG
jgi:DNA repair ATPase RecN